ncbi:MAG: hypothetical protein K6G11_00525, partial [Lachnospiraceae bacterium]|nr:hypothetical protein [Lachnospiraceae bacterium]
FGNLYDAIDFKKYPAQKRAMNALFVNTFAMGENPKGNIASLSFNLKSFRNAIVNGQVVYDMESGSNYNLIGTNQLKNPSTSVKLSLQYLDTFIKTLDYISKVKPYSIADSLDVDSFIDQNCNIKTNEINSKLGIKNAGPVNTGTTRKFVKKSNSNDIDEDNDFSLFSNENQEANQPKMQTVIVPEIKNVTIRKVNDGVYLSNKFKYKLLNLNMSKNEAWKKLKELDSKPHSERDNDLRFSLIITNSYWKYVKDDEAFSLTDKDREYLSNRLNTDPSFAKNLENIVEFGFGERFWGNLDLFVPYIFHNKNYEVQDKSKYQEFRNNLKKESIIKGDDDIVEFDQKKIDSINSHMEVEVKAFINHWKTFDTEKDTYNNKLSNEINLSFNTLKNDLVSGQNSYDAVLFDDNPKYDYSAAAGIIARSEMGDPNYIITESVSDQYYEWKRKLDARATELANSRDFVMYIKENGQNIISGDIYGFIGGYMEYKDKIATLDRLISTGTNPFFVNKPAENTKEAYKAECKNIIKNAKDNIKTFSDSNAIEAADYILANTFTKKAAEVSFFKRLLTEDSTALDTGKMNREIEKARRELLDDPAFKTALSKQLSPKKFYEKYTETLNEEANNKIKAENTRKKDIRKTRGEEARINKFMSDNNQTITEEQAKEIKTAYENLLEYNKSKSPSDTMKKFSNALKEVVDEMGADGKNTSINMLKLHNLNKYTLKYYDKRQGWLFSPQTDDGQSRLATAEKLTKTMDKIIKKMRADNPQISKSNPAPANNAATKNSTAKKVPANNVATKNPTAKKAPAKNSTAKKAPAKK